jgi:hypothetical protein
VYWGGGCGQKQATSIMLGERPDRTISATFVASLQRNKESEVNQTRLYRSWYDQLITFPKQCQVFLFTRLNCFTYELFSITIYLSGGNILLPAVLFRRECREIPCCNAPAETAPKPFQNGFSLSRQH